MSEQDGDRFDDAVGRAFRYLGHRDRTVAEMRAHLEGAAVPEAVLDRVLAHLGDDGYLDDARFARRFAEDRRSLDAWGSERIERRLRELGLDPEPIAAALAEGGAEELDSAALIGWPVAKQLLGFDGYATTIYTRVATHLIAFIRDKGMAFHRGAKL